MTYPPEREYTLSKYMLLFADLDLNIYLFNSCWEDTCGVWQIVCASANIDMHIIVIIISVVFMVLFILFFLK